MKFATFVFYLIIASFLTTSTRPVAAQRKPAATAARANGSLKVITGQPGSIIFINGVRHGVTDETGVVTIKRVWAGSFAARVRSIGFSDFQGRVVIAANTTRTLKVVQQPTSEEA